MSAAGAAGVQGRGAGVAEGGTRRITVGAHTAHACSHVTRTCESLEAPQMRGVRAAREALTPHHAPQGHPRDPTLILRRFRNSKCLAAPQMRGAHATHSPLTPHDAPQGHSRDPTLILRRFCSSKRLAAPQMRGACAAEIRATHVKRSHEALTPQCAPQGHSCDATQFATLILRRFRSSKRVAAPQTRGAHAA